MVRQQKKLLNPHAMRCEPYNDGHWCFVYDAENLDSIRELGGYEAMIGEVVGVDAECWLERLTDRGLAVAWELGGDDAVVVDVLVEKVLNSGQKQKVQWLEPQYAYLNVPSGRLRIETLNSLAFSPDAPTDPGCEIKIPPGQYDMILHRVNWPLMDEDMEERPEVPTEFLVLRTIKKKGPIRKTARLTYSEALGDDGAWLKAKIQFGDVLELRMGTVSRTTYLHCNPKAFLAEAREQILSSARPGRAELKKKIEAVQDGDNIPDVYTELSELRAQLDALVPEPKELDAVPLLLKYVEISISPERQILLIRYCFVSTKFNNCIMIQIFDENPINNGPVRFKKLRAGRTK
ncbi:hypothetical protein [Desulfobacter latus]|uniref:Uncharacterized protein n=1 Tax=Desulfobacter latus TaxID=2292 RepID=A0A850T8E9_9BACT|nr:hypothetical protein [Desulfobacter latus]NWH05752.1 hypothetical protein [Desulfobacter latus]